ncbi:MAG TPA: DUF1049 domain-containing protein [Xanthomonadaceae bacterium]|jgi:uncharacterized integral membrane protein|nr:DUF1049 domain-containing protein [Xanthomonadaceae bacterium]
MRSIRLLLAVLCIAFGVAVAALNDGAVRVDLLWAELDLPLGLLLLGVLLVGALLGGLAALLSRSPGPARPEPPAGDERSE